MSTQSKLNNIFLNALIDGVTGAALFGKLRWYGAPKSLIDYRSVEQYLASPDCAADKAVAAAVEARRNRSPIDQSASRPAPFVAPANPRKETSIA